MASRQGKKQVPHENPLTLGGPRDIVYACRNVIAMLEELFLNLQEGDNLSDEAKSGVTFTLGCIGSALQEAEIELDKKIDYAGAANG